MTTRTAVRHFRTFAGKGEGDRRREKMPVRTDDPSDSQAPTRIGRAGRGPTASRRRPGRTNRRDGLGRPRRSSADGESADERVADGTIRKGTVRDGTGAAATSGRLSGRRAPIVLDRYRLRRRLGTGGFATVWLARDERLDRDVAIKILPRERVVGGRFEREARAAARLAHPGIVTLYEAAVDDEGAYLVSELVHGSTLDRLLAEGRLSDRDVVQIGIALCDALCPRPRARRDPPRRQAVQRAGPRASDVAGGTRPADRLRRRPRGSGATR